MPRRAGQAKIREVDIDAIRKAALGGKRKPPTQQ
jgi:hypothetical protein